MKEVEHGKEGSGRRGAWEGGKWKKRSMGGREVEEEEHEREGSGRSGA